MTDTLAETLTEIMEQRQDNFVTKADLRIEISELRTELHSRMDKIENNLNWLKGIGFIIVGLLVKIALFS